MNNNQWSTIGAVTYLILLLLGFIGYINNIFKIALDVEFWGGFEVMRVVGVFIPPIGAIMGWI